VTAEEQGLLGSEYYAAQPLYPLAKTLADINMDALNVSGRTKDLVVIGLGASELDDYARAAAKEQGRTLKPDAEPEKGFYYRSDHFNFAKVGVPALNTDEGVEFVVGKCASARWHWRCASVHTTEPLPQARRSGRGDARLGPSGLCRGRPAAVHGRLPRRPGRHLPSWAWSAGHESTGDPGRAAERDVSRLTADRWSLRALSSPRRHGRCRRRRVCL
jgi:hypothetical protein